MSTEFGWFKVPSKKKPLFMKKSADLEYEEVDRPESNNSYYDLIEANVKQDHEINVLKRKIITIKDDAEDKLREKIQREKSLEVNIIRVKRLNRELKTELQKKDEEVKEKDEGLKKKDEELKEKDEGLKKKDEELKKKDE